MTHDKHIPSITDEIASVKLPDSRLVERTQKVVKVLEKHPDKSFPDAFDDDAQLRGAYRLLNNPAVSPRAILAPHVEASAQRCRAVGSVLVIHDSSKIIFSKTNPRTDLHKLGPRQFGYMTHVSLSVSADGLRCPLGLLALDSVDPNRCKGLSRAERDTHPERPQLRWVRGVEASAQALGDDVERVHVMDREADSFETMARLDAIAERFIIRLCYDRKDTRRVDQDDQEAELIELCQTTRDRPVLARRSVELSQRIYPPGITPPRKYKIHPERQARRAELAVRAQPVELARPVSADATLPERLEVCVVHVLEENPPPDCEPVEWFLLTSLKPHSPQEVDFVVDSYVARWLVEELFKGIKTGCRLEERQLQSLEACRTVEALMMPIAYKMLTMRHLSRQEANISANAVLTDSQRQVLRKLCASKRRKLPNYLTVKRALEAIAELGGHANRHQPFGWLVLYRGWRKVLETEDAWRLMRS